ncbi:hypothetical protein HJ192_06685 [Vibrio parahaemolyticus]|nr:hypothetical protein [Vibrio parahaemolyticus]
MNTKLTPEEKGIIERSGLFDPNFYALNCPDLLESGQAPNSDHYKNHFLEHGFF